MLKPIFDKDVNFFSKKIIQCAKGGDFKNGALHSDFLSCTQDIVVNILTKFYTDCFISNKMIKELNSGNIAVL